MLWLSVSTYCAYWQEDLMNPRTFLYGCIAGISITIGSLILVSAVAGVKWQPVPTNAR